MERFYKVLVVTMWFINLKSAVRCVLASQELEVRSECAILREPQNVRRTPESQKSSGCFWAGDSQQEVV